MTLQKSNNGWLDKLLKIVIFRSEQVNYEPKPPNMHNQRLFVLIASVMGAIATFLPWAKVPFIGSIDGTKGDGWITFGLFIIPILICILGNTSTSLNSAGLLGVVLPCLIAVGIGMWKFADFKSLMEENRNTDNVFIETFNQGISIGIGIYLVMISGILAIIFSLAIKNNINRSLGG